MTAMPFMKLRLINEQIELIIGNIYTNALNAGQLLMTSDQMIVESDSEADDWAQSRRALVKVFYDFCEEAQKLTDDTELAECLYGLDFILGCEWILYPSDEERTFVKMILNILCSRSDQLRSSMIQNCDISGGRGGPGGYGAETKAKSGVNGATGNVWIDDHISVPASICRLDNMIPAHPDQCFMVLELAKLDYFLKTPDSIKSCKIKLQRLRSRLAFVDVIQPTDPLYTTYIAATPSLHLIDRPGLDPKKNIAIESLREVKSQTEALWHQLASEVDYFGHTEDYAPRCSYKFYEEMLGDLLENMKIAEQAHMRFFENSVAQEHRAAAIKLTKELSQRSITYLDRHIKKLRECLDDQETTIVCLNSSLVQKKAELGLHLKGVEDRIQKAVPLPNINWQDFLGASTLLCFCPNAPMAIVQGSGLVIKACTEQGFKGDDGTFIKKDLLLENVRAISKVEDLMDCYHEVKDSCSALEVDENSGPKIIAQKEEIISLLKKFKSGLMSDKLDDVERAFQNYIGEPTSSVSSRPFWSAY